ncbi:MAG: hypothetical protein GWM98_22535, partial [Nitrospinaceae bacterium]|nr:hypothetical protein [Nitrospinaceae bacterium]NIT84038.1 hypothetical protein [Nitrospinaceae bacterium]NIY17453.1 hypothetical protein [Nitrospinaceae bacterium]
MKKHSVLGFLFFLTLAVLGSPLNGNLAYAGPKGIEFLEQLETGLIELSKKIRPSVVSLSPYVPSTPTGRLQGSLERGRPTNAGAGVIIDGRLGYIVTNH